MVAPRTFVLGRRTSPALWDHQAPLSPLCPTGIILPSPFMGFITTQRCSQTQGYNGGGSLLGDIHLFTSDLSGEGGTD